MNYGNQWSGTLSDFRFSQWSGSNMFYGNPTSTSGNNLYGSVSISSNQNTGWYDLEVYDQSTNQWVQKSNAFEVLLIGSTIFGCTDSTAANYNPLATMDDGSCIYCNQNAVDTLNYTGAMQTYVVPAGVTSVTIEAFGAQGAGDNGTTGGLGAYMSGDFVVNPFDQLKILVGENGGFDPSGSHSSGGGGGSCVVQNAGNIPMIIAGGGGGTKIGRAHGGTPVT